MKDAIKEDSARRSKNKMHKKTIKNGVARHFKASAKSISSKPLSVWRAPKLHGVESATAFLRKHSPPHASVVVHHNHAAWELSYPGCSRKTLAWTKRGLQATLAMSMLHMWNCHAEFTLEEAPWSLEEFQRIAESIVD